MRCTSISTGDAMGGIFGMILMMLVKLAIQMGMAWLAKKFPWLKPEQLEVIQTHVDEVKASKRKACEGIACPMDTV